MLDDVAADFFLDESSFFLVDVFFEVVDGEAKMSGNVRSKVV